MLPQVTAEHSSQSFLHDLTAEKHKAMLSKHSSTNKIKQVILQHFTAEHTSTQICDTKRVLVQHRTAGEQVYTGETMIERESNHNSCSPSSTVYLQNHNQF